MEPNAVCRLCLYNNEDIVSIFGDTQREAKLQEKLQQYLNLEVKEDDTLPTLICLKCFQTVESFHHFYQEVAQNQTVFAYSTQPGMIVISDQTSHTTYILREDEVMGQPCLDLNDGSAVKLEGLESMQCQPSTSALNGPHNVTLVQLQNAATTAVLSVVDPATSVLLSTAEEEASVGNVLPSELPTYDESQKGKDRPIGVKSEDALNQNSVSIDPFNGIEEDHQITEEVFELAKDVISQDDEELDVYDDDDVYEEVGENSTDLQLQNEECMLAQITDPFLMDLSSFPKRLIVNNSFVVRGKELSVLMARFYSLNCEICAEGSEQESIRFEDMDAYLIHCMQMHGVKGHVTCCNQKIFKVRMMGMHMARHIQPEEFQCPECGKFMTTPKILQYHLQNHRPEDERPLKCNQCPRRFSYGSALMAHSQSHLPEDERTRHVCDECGKCYTLAKQLTDHLNTAHNSTNTTESPTYVCHVCAKQFTSRSNLVYHLTTHQPKIHQVQCEQCNKWLKNKLCLRKHMVQHSLTRHECTLCNYSAVNKQCLKNHMRVQHSDSKPFECDICRKTFKLKNTLLNHKVQHTGVKKFNCEFCFRSFASSGNYYSHRKRMHPQELAVQKMRKEEEENEFRKNQLAKLT